MVIGDSAMKSRAAAASSSIEIATTTTSARRAASAFSLGKPLRQGLHHDAQTSMTIGEPRALADVHVPPASNGSVNGGSGSATALDLPAGAAPAHATSAWATRAAAVIRILRLLPDRRLD